MHPVLDHHQGEEPRALDHQAHRVFFFQVENVRGVPVGVLVNVAFRERSDDEVVQRHGHVDDAVLEIEFLVDFVHQIRDMNLVFFG